jgi:glyoxylase-like metal-dependent hydrolase (beta-lactamase superfamily II)
MIAWPNTVLLSGPGHVVIDPGYATQGDMLAQALTARGITPEQVGTVVMTHLHADHVSALPQLGEVELYVHEIEIGSPHAHAGRGWRDAARERPLSGGDGEVLPGIRFIHTPGHTDGHIALFVATDEGEVAIVGDTLGPDPSWFARMDLPAGHPRREEHLAAFRAIAGQLDPGAPTWAAGGHVPALPAPGCAPRSPSGPLPRRRGTGPAGNGRRPR